MFVSLNKNIWLYEWITHKWMDEVTKIVAEDFQYVDKRNLRQQLSILLNEKGYQAHLTSTNDIIIAMKETDYAFLRLKYE